MTPIHSGLPKNLDPPGKEDAYLYAKHFKPLFGSVPVLKAGEGY